MREHTELQHTVIVSLRKQPQTFFITDLSFQLSQISAGLTFPELIIQISFTHLFSALFCFYVAQKVIFIVGSKFTSQYQILFANYATYTSRVTLHTNVIQRKTFSNILVT